MTNLDSILGFPGGSDNKASACSVENQAWIPGLGRSPGEGNGNPLQYSCLENSMDWEAPQRLIGYSPWSRKESDTTERLHFHLDSILKSRDITLPTKFHLVKSMVFPVVMYWCESWTIKKAEHRRTEAFELWCWRTLESPLDCKEIQPVNPKGNQSWIFIGTSDAEAEAPILWKVVPEPQKTLGFLASRGEEFNPGPETRLDYSELLCNKVLLMYKRDRDSFWHRYQKGAERVPLPL